MGCDIDLFAEVRVSDEAGTRWERAEPLERRRRLGRMVDVHESWYGGRDYELFGHLAGVRGKAAPVVAPRGMPDDATGSVMEACELMDTNGHSHSWLTLRELLAHDWGEYEERQLSDDGGVGDFVLVLVRLRERLGTRDLDDARLVFWFGG